MARVGWLAIIAVGLMIVPSTIAQEGCTVTVTIPVTGASATIRMVRITFFCTLMPALNSGIPPFELASAVWCLCAPCSLKH